MGLYKASKVGSGYKLSIPKELVEIWGLEGGEDLFLYYVLVDGEFMLLTSVEPLKSDSVGQALMKANKH